MDEEQPVNSVNEYFQTKFLKVPMGKRFVLPDGTGPYTRVGRRVAQGVTPEALRMHLMRPVVRVKDKFFHWPPPPTLYGDPGVDPILGPPYPPTNYMATIWDSTRTDFPNSQPRITWTAPDVIVEHDGLDPVDGGGNIDYGVNITNYEWPAWSSGVDYIVNRRVSRLGVAYFARQAHTSSGANQPPNATFWGVDDTQFGLFVRGGADFDTGALIYADWELFDSVSAPNTFLSFQNGIPADQSVFYFYITADTNGITVYSNILSLIYSGA